MGVKRSAKQRSSESNLVEQKIIEILDLVRPMIVGHGGNVEFVKFQDTVVYVKLIGACTQCPFSLYTLKLGIEEQLRTRIPEVSRVEVAQD
jgi:Fe-S cluster biogenesis protein NfuA